jgi:hypothetical protein
MLLGAKAGEEKITKSSCRARGTAVRDITQKRFRGEKTCADSTSFSVVLVLYTEERKQRRYLKKNEKNEGEI